MLKILKLTTNILQHTKTYQNILKTYPLIIEFTKMVCCLTPKSISFEENPCRLFKKPITQLTKRTLCFSAKSYSLPTKVLETSWISFCFIKRC